MIPLLAAASAVNTASQVGTTAISQLTHLSGTGQGAARGTASASDSFGAILAAHGVSSSGPADPGAVGVGAVAAGQGAG